MGYHANMETMLIDVGLFAGFMPVTVGCSSSRSIRESWLDVTLRRLPMLADSLPSRFIRRSRLQSASSERTPNTLSTFTSATVRQS